MSDSESMELSLIREKLKACLLRKMPVAGKYPTDIEGLSMARREDGSHVENCFYRPSVGVIVQGTKQSTVGSEIYRYDERQFLVVGVDMPSSFRTVGASPERPFLAIGLDLDRYLISRLTMELPAVSKTGGSLGVAVTQSDPDILDAFLRLAELLDRPEQIPFMAPLIVREIHYRLLIGPHGETLRKLSTLGTQSNQITEAIEWLKQHYREPLHVESLAHHVNMGVSTFHRHFKEVTSLSPLQYHKRLRLFEAQRLMLAEDDDASSAALKVGYESPTQFNREYKRMFGEPPRRDIMRLR